MNMCAVEKSNHTELTFKGKCNIGTTIFPIEIEYKYFIDPVKIGVPYPMFFINPLLVLHLLV